MTYNKLKRFNSIFLFTSFIIVILYFGAEFLIPFTLAIFLAALMKPVSDFFEKIYDSRIISSLLSTFLVFLFTGAILYFLVSQATKLVIDLPEVRDNMQDFLATLQNYIANYVPLTPEEQVIFIQERSDIILGQVQQSLAIFAGNIFTTFMHFLIIIVYIFLLLHSRNKIQNFFLMYVPRKKEEKTKEILKKTSRVAQQYLWGRIKVMFILGVMYIITFLIFDIPYAFLLTIFGTIITVIPYIGPLLSGVAPVFFVIIFGRDSGEVLIFAAVILVIQLLESYILEPLIMGSEVQLSPLAVVIAIVLGNIFWGITGMILFVPIFAIIKIIADQADSLKPIGYLIGYSKRLPIVKIEEDISKK
jgi:predicted PurR-regulated permease PerM